MGLSLSSFSPSNIVSHVTDVAKTGAAVLGGSYAFNSLPVAGLAGLLGGGGGLPQQGGNQVNNYYGSQDQGLGYQQSIGNLMDLIGKPQVQQQSLIGGGGLI